MPRIPFPLSAGRPLVVGSVSDLDTWMHLTESGAELPCDVVELRLDLLPADCDLAAVAARPCPRPLIVTCRHETEGGGRPMEDAERIAAVRAFLPVASAVDWEILEMALAEELMDELQQKQIPLLASCHFFEETPDAEQMISLAECAWESGAAMAKFAFMLHSGEDIQQGVRLLAEGTGALAVMGMGTLGPVSRLLYAQLGSCLVYGYLGKRPSAPGQWSAADCREVLAKLGSAC